jgi:hypothetical protein
MLIVMFILHVIIFLAFLYIFRPSLDIINSFFLLKKYVKVSFNYKIAMFVVILTYLFIYYIYIIYYGVYHLLENVQW